MSHVCTCCANLEDVCRLNWDKWNKKLQSGLTHGHIWKSALFFPYKRSSLKHESPPTSLYTRGLVSQAHHQLWWALALSPHFHSGFQVQTQLEKVRAELEMQSQHTARLESSCRALERSLGQSSKRLQVSTDPTVHYHHSAFVLNTIDSKSSGNESTRGKFPPYVLRGILF